MACLNVIQCDILIAQYLWFLKRNNFHFFLGGAGGGGGELVSLPGLGLCEMAGITVWVLNLCLQCSVYFSPNILFGGWSLPFIISCFQSSLKIDRVLSPPTPLLWCDQQHHILHHHHHRHLDELSESLLISVGLLTIITVTKISMVVMVLLLLLLQLLLMLLWLFCCCCSSLISSVHIHLLATAILHSRMLL